MVDLGIAPPPPPKFLEERMVKEPKKKKDNKNNPKKSKDNSKSKSKFPVSEKLTIPKPVEEPEQVLNEDIEELDELREEDIKEMLDDGKTIPEPSFQQNTKEVEPKKSSLFGRMFGKKPKDDISNDGNDWTSGDLIDEYHNPNEKSVWDKEDFHPQKDIPNIKPASGVLIPKPSKAKTNMVVPKVPKAIAKPKSKSKVKVSKKVVSVKSVTPMSKSKKPNRKDIVDMSKIPVKKSHKSKVLVAPKRRKERRGPVDRVVDQYFKTVEREQLLIQKELERIVSKPNKGLTKTSENYVIHHNEKLIKSMKHLLVVLQTIDDVKFRKNVASNKQSFEKWVKSILDKEKKAELQRNVLLKKELIRLFKDYAAGLSKDVDDKKYELSELKKDADNRLKKAVKFEEKLSKTATHLDERNEDFKRKNADLNKLISEKVSNQLSKKVKKERISLNRTEGRLKHLIDEYTQKSHELKQGFTDLENAKQEAQDLLSSSSSLKRLKTRLENKDTKLKTEVSDLVSREKKLKSQIKELDLREKELESRDKKLLQEVNKLEKKDELLEQRKKELGLQVRDFEVQKKHFDLRLKEIQEMEGIVSQRTEVLHHLQDEVTSTNVDASKKLNEVKNLVDDIQHREMENMNAPKLSFDEYIRPPEKPVSSEKKDGDYFDLFNQKIVTCRDMISNRQLADAKKTYTELKQMFITSSVDPKHKEVLYNTIRELYDDIYLSLLDS